MATKHTYHVIYTVTGGSSAAADIHASTPDNAVAGAKSNDSNFKDLISVTQKVVNGFVGS